jgi:hypothetical protein
MAGSAVTLTRCVSESRQIHTRLASRLLATVSCGSLGRLCSNTIYDYELWFTAGHKRVSVYLDLQCVGSVATSGVCEHQEQ